MRPALPMVWRLALVVFFLAALPAFAQVPSVPTGLTATPDNAQLTLNWAASTNVINYTVKRSTVSGGPYTAVASLTPRVYTDTGLTNGTTYYYVVSASNGSGESANSTQVAAVPSVAPGYLDDQFGGTGRVRTNFNPRVLVNAGGWDSIIQAPNSPNDPNYRKIVVVGSTSEGSRPRFGIIRLNINGTRDMGFGIRNPTNDSEGTYVNDGTVREVFDDSGWDTFTDALMQPDNKIVAFGYVNKTAGGEDWRVVRYTANGDRDTTFGNSNPKNGIVYFNVPITSAARSKELAIDSQGRIYAAGYGNMVSGDADMFVYRVLTDGTIDQSWGDAATPGYARININGFLQTCKFNGTPPCSEADQAWSVRVQSSGRVVIAGRANNQPVMMRLYGEATDPDGGGPLPVQRAGTRDTSFGNNGYVFFNVYGVWSGGNPYGSNVGPIDYFRGMTIDPQDRIIGAGRFQYNGVQHGFICRLLPNGAVDTSFGGGDGWTPELASGQSVFDDVEVAANGKLVATGTISVNNDFQIAAFRYNSDGSIDSSFCYRDAGACIPGSAIVNVVPGYTEISHGVAIQPDGDILVPSEGNAVINGVPLDHMMVVRFNGTDGTLDTTFNSAGQILTSAINKPGVFATRLTGSSADFSYGTAIQPDGKVIQVGKSWNGWDYDFAITRLTTAGVPDITFGDRAIDCYRNNANVLVCEPYSDVNRRNGKIVLDSGSVTIPDNTDTAYSVAVQSTGRIVIAGTTSSGGGADQTKLFRVYGSDPDGAGPLVAGSLDTTFGTSGFRTDNFSAGGGDRPRKIIVDAQDRIYLVGDTAGGGQTNLLLARYTAAGSLEFSNSFNRVFFEEGHDIALQPDGKVVVGGRAAFSGGAFHFYVGRFTVTTLFALDSTFSLGRRFDVATNTIVADPAYVGLYQIPHETRATPTSVNTDPTGTPLSAFDEAFSVVVEADGKITLGGRSAPANTGQAQYLRRPRYALARLTSSGWMDTTFGTNGWVETSFEITGPTTDLEDSVIKTLVAQNDGKLVGLGTASSSFDAAIPGSRNDSDFAAARYNWDNGTLDTAFGIAGKKTVGFGTAQDDAFSGLMASDGKIILGGHDTIREDFVAVRWHGDGGPSGTHSNAPDLTTDSTRANYAGTADNRTNDNSPTFAGSPCVSGESIILKVVNTSTSAEHFYKARDLCRAADNNLYGASVPSYFASGGSFVYGQSAVAFLPDGTYNVQAFSATGGGSTALSPTLSSVVIDTRADLPPITSPTGNPIEKKNAEQAIVFSGTGAETTADVTVWDTWNPDAVAPPPPPGSPSGASRVTWSATTGRITAGAPVPVCTALSVAAGGNWTCQTPAHPAVGALALGHHRIKAQQEDIAGNRSVLCIPPGTTQWPIGTVHETCTAEVQFYVKANTTASASSSANPSVYGQAVTFTTSVRSNVGTPTGTVVQSYDSVLQPAATLTNGDATYAPPLPLSVGNHTFSATYAETDKYFASATPAPPLSQVVNKASTAGTVTSALGNGVNSVYGQSVAITIAIDVTAPGQRQGVGCPACANPTGTVTVKVDNGAPQSLTYASLQATFTSSALAVGPHTIEFTYSGDGNFNGVTVSYPHTVDKGATTTTVTSSANPSVSGQPLTLTGTVTANLPAAGTRTGTLHFKNGGVSITGCEAVTINASGAGNCMPASLATASHAITADYSGDGNFLTSTGSLTQVVNKASTTGVLTSSLNPSTFGQSTTLTATLSVTAPGTGALTGTVEFRSAGVAISGCTAQPVNAGVATCATTAITAGTRALTAHYSGDTNFNTSTSNTVSQVVNKSDTTTTLAVDVNPSRFGEAVTFTATMAAVAPGAGTPSGTINFRDNLVTIPGCGTQALTAGVATCTVSTLSLATHPITAVYSSDADFNASTSNTINQDVQKGESTTAVTSSANPSVTGQAVTFTSTITPVAPATGIPSGAVTFKNGGVDIAGCVNVPLAGGAATCGVVLSIGTHTITVDYAGDISFNGSNGTLAGDQTVNKASTSNTVTASPLNAVFGQSVTVTSTVVAVAPGSGTPTGMASFTIDGVAGVPGALDGSGAISTTIPALIVGPHTFSNTYDGDASFNGSTGTLSYTVVPAQTSVVLGGAGTTLVGEAFTVSATVSVTAPGSGIPTGSVTIGDGVDSCTLTLTGGTGSCSLALFTPGARTLTATYSGDLSFATSSSTAPQTVNAAATTTTITGHTPAPSSVGSAVLVTFTVTANAPGSGTPAGTVTVSDGVDSCSATVAVGQCSITLSTFGTRTLTATFAATAAYLTSSDTASHHVKPPTTTSITDDTPDPSVVGQGVVVKFAVTDPNALGTPTGSVTVSDGVDSCSASVATGQCTLTFSTIGLRTLTATYSGDATYDMSVGSTTHRVKGDTSVTISSTAPSSSVSGQSVIVNYSVAVTPPGSGAPTGDVTVTDGATSCMGTVAAGQCTITFATGGPRSLTANYPGDADYNGSTSTGFAHVVGLAPTTLTLSDTPDPSLINTAVNVTWNLTVDAPGAGTPTGTVTVTDGVDSCSAPVATGACSITLMTQGARTLTASYAGDSNFAATSASAAHQVKANTTTTISGTLPSTSVVGQNVAVSWNVTVTAPGTGTPTGTMTVSDGTSTCSAPVGDGSCTIAFPTVGVHNLVATYGGDATYNGSISGGFGHTVTQASSTTTITSVTPSPSMIAAAAMVSFTVTANPPGAGTPAGNVTVSNGTDSCTGTVAAGQCSITFTHAGPQSLTAIYAGDTNFTTSSSSAFVHSVNRALTSLAITAHTPDPSVIGGSVNVTWNLTVQTPGAGTATGLVTVSDGGDSCSAPVATGGCSITLSTLGTRTLTASYAGDADFSPAGATAGHTVRANTTVAISGTAPATTVTGQSVAVSWNVLVVAPGTGTPTGTVTVTDGTTSCSAAVGTGTCSMTLPTAGTHSFVATYAGDANYNVSTSLPAAHVVTPAGTTTAIVSANPNPSTVGVAYPVLFTVAPVAPGSGIPTGTVTVTDGTDTCSASVAAGQCNLTSTTLGAKTLAATYAGDANFATSTSPGLAHQVMGASSLTINASTPNPSVSGQSVAISVTAAALPPGIAAPTGTVTVSDGTQSCTVSLSGGTGSCSLTFATAGTRTLTATYGGDVLYAGSAATATHSIQPASTTASITSRTPATGVSGQPVVIAFAVTVNGPGAGAPTGTVTISDGTQSCSGTVAAGQCTIAFATSGARNLTASYSGDGNFAASTSGAVVHTTSMADTATTIVSHNANPSVAGQQIVTLFDVVAVAPGAGTPTGNVTVQASTGESCAATTAAGQCTITFANAGARTLTATYGGDANFNISASAPAAHAVDKASTTTTITGHTPAPSIPGEAVIVTWSVAVTAPGASPVTGTVTVSDGTISCSAPVAAGQCVLTFTTAGSKALVGVFSGDANLNGSTSLVVAHVVNRAATATAIIAHTPDPSQTVAPVRVQFTVSAVPPANGTPTGTVTVSDGSASCTGTVATGECTLTLFAPIGAHTLTAVYNGDTNFAPSTSAGVTHQVVNRSPQSQDDFYSGNENEPIQVQAPGVLSNDIDVDGPQPITAILVNGPGSGDLTLNANGSFIYVPRSGFEGEDSFTYQACDSQLCSRTTNVALRISPSQMPTATVTGSATICAGAEATLQIVLTGPGPWTLTWSDGHIQTVTAAAVSRTVQPQSTTTYVITSVLNPHGSAAGSGSAMVTVISVSAPVITASSPIVFNQPVTLTATGGYTSYQWYRNNAPIPGATSSVLTIAALGPSNLGNYSVTGTREGCVSARSAGVTIAPVDEESIISVIGATPGVGGARFRTVMQLSNGSDQPIDGSIEWSVTGGATTDPVTAYPFSLGPGQTKYVDDVLPPGFTGLASASIKQIRGGLPLGLVHVFNDMGELGTTGMLQRTVAASTTLTQGDRAVLITPADPEATRFNIGMRALRSGLQVRMTRRDAEGKQLGVNHASLEANAFRQTTANALLGATIGGGESLEFEILSGGGIIYGAATDNKTNDPNMQMAARVAPRGSGRSVIAVAGSVAGAFGSRFATEAQIHNAGSEAMRATVRFHPAGTSGTADDPSLDFTIAPRATLTLPDVVASLGTSGLGSMDLVTTSAIQPIVVVRVYSISEAGQTSMTEDVVPAEDALRQGERGIILAPHDLKLARFNIGIRSLDEGVTLTVTVRNADGTVAKVLTRNYPANYFTQSAAGSLLEMDLQGDQQILFRVDQGAAVIYGVWTDNRTQDPSLQFAVRP